MIELAKVLVRPVGGCAQIMRFVLELVQYMLAEAAEPGPEVGVGAEFARSVSHR